MVSHQPKFTISLITQRKRCFGLKHSVNYTTSNDLSPTFLTHF